MAPDDNPSLPDSFDEAIAAAKESGREEEARILQELKEKKKKISRDIVITEEDVEKLREAVDPLSSRKWRRRMGCP